MNMMKFHQYVELRNLEVFAYFVIGKGPIFSPKSGLGKSLFIRSLSLNK